MDPIIRRTNQIRRTIYKVNENIQCTSVIDKTKLT